jgi:ribosomal protein S12 methylthiotransferase accessory factor
VLADPSALGGPAGGLEVCLHGSAEQVEQCLGRPGRLVVWPEREGLAFCSPLDTEELREAARLLVGELRGARVLVTPTLATLLGRHPFLAQALEAVLRGELAARTPRLSLLVPAPLHLRRHSLERPPSVEAPPLEAQEGSARAESPFRHLRALPQELVGGPFSLLPRPPRRFLSVRSLALSHAAVEVGEHVDDALGRGLDFQHADLTAAFEALERRCGFYTRQLPALRGSFARLHREQPVLDPRLLLLPEASPSSRLVPYDESLEVDWVPGYSLRHRAPLLVPARAVFLGYQEDRLLLHESSNGCALGGSLEEALLHALFELIERDAFLMTWYARRPVVRLELDAVADRRIPLLCDQAERLGYSLRAYRTTVDAPLPSVWVMAVAHGERLPHTLSSAGAHLRPEQAVLSALVEVVGSLTMMAPGFDLARGRACMADPTRVQTAMDHLHLFGVPEQFPQLAFLEQGGRQPLAEAFAAQAPLARGRSLTGKLEALVQALLEHHPDVIFVELTPRRLARQGLRCVRALVPGMLPMTFGHANRRVHGCERLRKLREQVRPGSGGEDFLPHPFP